MASQRSMRREYIEKPLLLVVGYFNPDYYPPTFNAVGILREHFRVRIICRNVRAIARQWPDDVRIERIGRSASDAAKMTQSAIAKFAEFRAFINAVSRAIESSGPRLIYAYEPYGFVAAIRGAAKKQIPIIYHLHELPDLRSSTLVSLQSWVNRRALRNIQRADTVVFPERQRAELYMQACGDRRAAFIVPNCSALAFCPALPEWKLAALAPRRWRLRECVYVGSIGDAHSNLESARALRHLSDGTRFTLVGWGDEQFMARLTAEAARSGAADRVAFEGSRPHDQIAERAMNATVGLAIHKPVSDTLTYSAAATNKLFEYAACGLPTVVADTPNYREFLAGEDWVAYANPYDEAEIARAIESLLADPEHYLRASLAARRFFTERYHYELAFEPLMRRFCELAGLEPGAQRAVAP